MRFYLEPELPIPNSQQAKITKRNFMNQLFLNASAELSSFLAINLPELGENWWNTHVKNLLSFQQQRTVEDHNLTRLEHLDFAALLRILDKNWQELSKVLTLPREGLTWVRELQLVSNRWAHQSAISITAEDLYRDIDTLTRVLNMLEAAPDTMSMIEVAKADALSKMSTASDASTISKTLKTDSSTKSKASIQHDKGSAASTMFNVGDLVALRSNHKTMVPIIGVLSGGLEPRYTVFQDNRQATYYESQLLSLDSSETQSFLRADELRAFLTSLYLLSQSTASLYSLRCGRVQFVPYQYRPVLRLIRSDRPRLLIADEVGVGKTIEAGLIIKELQARSDISSILVICPKALVTERKWYLEMKRFDEHFEALNGQTLRHCLRETHFEGEWPDRYSKVIIPFSLLDSNLLFGKERKGSKTSEGLLSLDPPPKFDLVIVDEAHHIRNSDTYLHQAVRYFCDNAEASVFLTATPVQLGSRDLFVLLNVLRPDLVIDQASFEQMAAPNKFINIALNYCRTAEDRWQIETRNCLKEASQTEWGRLFLRELPSFQETYDYLREDRITDTDRIRIIRALEELYTFSPIINRTRRRDIGEFSTRKPETLTIEFTTDQQSLYDTLLDTVSYILEHTHGQQNVKFMMTTLHRQAASCLYGLVPFLRDMLSGRLDSLESEIEDNVEIVNNPDFLPQIKTNIESLIKQAEILDPHDPKIQAFIKILYDKNEMINNKVLVFSTFRHTLAYISRHVADAGLRYGLVHGSIPDEKRSNLRRRFALPKEDSDALDILLSSEIGGEGLDFQFCDLLINYDLPWNPMRIEQRIGRIDRYGQQSESVTIINMVTPGTVDADIYERCLMRIGIFHHSVGASEEILGDITREIHNIVETFTITPTQRAERLQQLGDNKIRQIQEEIALEEKQSELFGLSVPNQSWHEDILESENIWLSPESLQRCVSAYLFSLGSAKSGFLLGDKIIKTLRLDQSTRADLLNDFRKQPQSTDPVSRQWQKWLKGADPLLRVTFDQKTAATEPKVVHLNVLHPLVRQAAQSLQRVEAVHVNLTVASTSNTPGIYPFALYQWRRVGIRVDDTLVVVSSNPQLDDDILSLLDKSVDTSNKIPLTKTTTNGIEERHHDLWRNAQANHLAENQNRIQHLKHSLSISHAARCNLLKDQIDNATNEKIRRMKESEMTRADNDYNHRIEELQRLADCADIHSNLIVEGVLQITKDESL